MHEACILSVFLYVPKRLNRAETPMRAEINTAIADIEKSMNLLRRHL